MTENELHAIIITAVRLRPAGAPIVLDCPEYGCGTYINEIHALFRADSDGIVTIENREYKVVCLPGQDRVALLPPEMVRDFTHTHTLPAQPAACRRTLADLKAWWIQGLVERGIPLVVPNYAKLSYPPATGTWEKEDSE